MKLLRQKDQALWLFMLVLMLILLGIFLPISARTWAGFGIKTGIFILVFFLLYFFGFNPISIFPAGIKRSLESSGEADAPQEGNDSASVSVKGSGDAFAWFCQTFIAIVRNATAASVIGLYLRKGDTLELHTAESETQSSYPRRLVYEGTLIDKVIQQNGSACESNLPAQSIMPGIDDFEISSFAGVSLTIEEKLAGVLAMGSEAREHFSAEDLELLLRCSQLICQVMSVYHRAWRQDIQETLWQTRLEMEQALRDTENEMQAFNMFVQYLSRLFLFDRCTLCYMDHSDGEIRQVYGQIDQFDRGARFPIDEGLHGLVMKRNLPLVIEDIQEGSYIRPRYYEGEDTRHGLHSFLGAPLGKTNVWGCLSIESKRIAYYKEREKNGLLTILPFFELTLERIRLMQEREV